MRWCRFVLSVSLCACLSSAPVGADPRAMVTNLLPLPSSAQFGSGRLAVDASFQIGATGTVDDRLRHAVGRALVRLSRQTGLEISRELSADATKARLTIVCDGPGASTPSLDENESYSLEVTADRATLRAPTVVGALRGLETVLQLLTADRVGWYLPAVTIQDTPRFRWRGLLIDVARHWMPMDVLKRNLDLMAAVKLNVLHLHLTEDQGFRIESKRYPSLHQKGSDGNYFTQAEMKDLIGYAAERGIRVVPEFDMPGHSTSWLVGHPELGSAPGPYSIERTWGIMEPALDPTREEVYKLLDGFLGEMAALFPDAYLHIGGDENKGKQWMANDRITAFMKQHDLADAHALQAYFNRRLLTIVQKHGKKMIGWDEVLHPDLPKDVVVQSWRGPKSLGEAAKQGYSGILSNGYYIDLNYPTSQHYVVDPLPDSLNLTPEEAARVLGGEACMWSEYVDPGNIDSRLWPRLAAIAERFWSPKTVTDVDDVYRRMALFSPWLEIAGSRHITGQGILVRNLAKGGDVAAVGTLISLIEPVKEYKRGDLHKSTQLTPLTRVSDTAQPESFEARRVNRAIDGLIADAPRFSLNADNLAATFSRWRDAGPAISAAQAGSPALAEAGTMPGDMTALGALGLEALAYLRNGSAPPDGWADAALARVKTAEAPRAECEFAMLSGVRLLVAAADQRAAFDPSDAAGWQAKVKSRADVK
jgi:hexosaminidase